ncbi:MAG: class I SAM-dependent methyltransferase [Gemmataceae bacterium]
MYPTERQGVGRIRRGWVVRRAELADETLAAVVEAASLDAPDTREVWEWRLQCALPWPVFDGYRRRRDDCYAAAKDENDVARVAAVNEEFFAFANAHPDLCRLFAAGRLGYYDAVLPKVAARLRRAPPARILDLGSFAGVSTLYLGAAFPDSQVVGVERHPGAVAVAEEARARCGLGNVSFACADFTAFDAGTFDAVVSLQAMPACLLPWLPAERPEDYSRGSHLEEALGAPAAPALAVARAVAAVRRLTAAGGRAVLHERVVGLPRALLFQHLLARAGLDVTDRCWADWHSVSQRDVVQSFPLIVARAADGAAPSDEAAMIALYALPAGPDLTGLPRAHGVTYSGFHAHAAFAALPAPRDELCLRAGLPDGRRLHGYFGIAGGFWAYVYRCDTHDERMMTVGDRGIAPALFRAGLDELGRLSAAGQLAQCDPPLDKFRYHVGKRFKL